MTILRELALPIIGAAGFLLLASPATAQEQGIVVTGKLKMPTGYEPIEKVVDIEDLDLTTSAGEKEMEKRVTAAVKSMCAAPPRAARWQVKDAEMCSEFAWASARPQMEEALRMARGS